MKFHNIDETTNLIVQRTNVFLIHEGKKKKKNLLLLTFFFGFKLNFNEFSFNCV